MGPAGHDPLSAALADPRFRSVRRLVVHIGMPKTGTTALQTLLHRHRGELRSRGILYPTSPHPEYPGMHTWLSSAALNDSADAAADAVRRGLLEVDGDVTTVVLSNEVIWPRWQEITEQGRRLLRTLAERFQTEVWIWLRDPAAVTASGWIEVLTNPYPDLARPGSVHELLDDPSMQRVLDYRGMVADVEAVFGAGAARVMPYEGDTVEKAAELLGTPAPWSKDATIVRRSPGVVALRLVRLADRLRVPPRLRPVAVRAAVRIDRFALGWSPRLRLSPAELARVRAMTDESLRALERSRGLQVVREQQR
jgi:hypothetical protein